MSITPMQDNDKKPIEGTFADATPLLADPERLRARAGEDGMLFFRGLLPRERVLDVRRRITDVLDRYGVLDRRRDPIEAAADLDAIHRIPPEELQWYGVGLTKPMYRDIQRLEAFHALAHSPEITAMFDTLFGEPALVHPRNIARVMLPHRDAKATPSHQDFLHIQGSTNTWTCWIPLGDVPVSLGGLAVLKGSWRSGLLGVTEAPGAGGLESILCGLDYEWQTIDYEAGDVLAFHSYTVHKALPNRMSGRIRMSCDYRYQPVGEAIEAGSLRPHAMFEWEELYDGWERADLQYYWRDMKLQYADFDESIRWQKDKIC